MKSSILFSFFLTTCIFAKAQSSSLTGRLLDSKNRPIIGANLYIKGTEKGTITQQCGEFTLTTNTEFKTIVIFIHERLYEYSINSSQNTDPKEFNFILTDFVYEPKNKFCEQRFKQTDDFIQLSLKQQ